MGKGVSENLQIFLTSFINIPFLNQSLLLQDGEFRVNCNGGGCLLICLGDRLQMKSFTILEWHLPPFFFWMQTNELECINLFVNVFHCNTKKLDFCIQISGRPVCIKPSFELFAACYKFKFIILLAL